jgi:hypothetical protein
MRAVSFSILIILISFFSNAQSSETFTAEGVITEVHHGDIIGLDRLELSINGSVKNLTFYFQALYEDSLYLNKKVKITYTVSESLKEVDMYANGSSVYYNRKTKDISKALKVEGILDIYDYGCAMPGTYYIKSADSTITTIRHYVEGKYQKPYEFKNVTVYYSIKETNFVLELSFIDSMSSNSLEEIPEAFFKQTGISKESIATEEKVFSSGCVKGENQKSIKLDDVKTDKKNNTQVIRLTFGGKRLYTKEYHLSTNQKGALIIKEKDL